MSEPLVTLECLLACHRKSATHPDLQDEGVLASRPDRQSQTISWHTILNNHSSKKPKCLGGPMFHSLGDLKVYDFVDGLWHCTISMPCSFQRGDNIPVHVVASAETKQNASEQACLRALAHIFELKTMHPSD